MRFQKKTLGVFSKDGISFGDLKITWGEVAWVILLSFIFILFFLVSDSFWIFNILIIPAVLVGYYKNDQLTQLQQRIVTSLTLAAIFTCIIRIVLVVYKSILLPPEWDFHLYWIYGQVGAHFLNPYDPANLLKFAQTLNPSDAFLGELYFFQFPPLIFLFLPLGWFGITTAACLWYIFLLIAMMLDIYLLWSIFFNRMGYKQLLFVTLLTLVLGATFDTLWHAQINLVVLLAFLLYWRKRESFMGGIWLGIGMIVKPILVIALIYPVLRKHWRALLGVAAAIMVSSVITIIVFGQEMFLGYFTDNPIVRNMPNYLYTEDVNQSLLATILRLTNFDFSNGSPYLQPMFIITALLLTGITSFLLFQMKDEKKIYSDFALALTMTFALLIFPKTLTHYAVLLIVPTLTIWANRNEAGINTWFILTFITVEYVLVSLEGNFIFISILISWLLTVGICAKLLLARPYEQIAS